MRFTLIISILALFLAPISIANEGSPIHQISKLIDHLKSDDTSTALQTFFSDSLMTLQKPEQIRAMDAQAQGAWQFYGAPTEFEISDTQEIGDSLMRVRWLTKHNDEIPLFWNVLFYRRHDKWEPLNIIFFDDPVKAGF